MKSYFNLKEKKKRNQEDPSTSKAEVGRALRVQDHPGLHNECQATLELHGETLSQKERRKRDRDRSSERGMEREREREREREEGRGRGREKEREYSSNSTQKDGINTTTEGGG